MGKSEARRQKALMKKRRKDKLRKKRSQRRISSIQGLSHLSAKNKIYNARKCPIHECLINPSWKEVGLARILLSRQQPDGNLVFGVYLVDIFCLGLKNTFCNGNLSLFVYENELKAKIFQEEKPIDCSVPLAHRIIYGAIDYASKLGFKPNKDFKVSNYILEEPEKIKEAVEIEFGKDGKPFFVAGPDDNADLIIKQLEARLGVGKFHYLISVKEEDLMILEEDDTDWMN